MSGHFELTATNRLTTGKSANRRMRRTSDLTPAIVYGGKKEPLNISLEHQHVLRALKTEAFLSHIITLTIEGKPEKVVVKSVQRHPYKPKIIHMDFLRISETDAITMRVPIHFSGGDIAPGVKLGGGLVHHLLNEVEIKCLPKDLPEYLTVDLSKLELDQSIHLSDLKLPKGVEIPILAQDNLPVASIHKIKAQEIEEPTVQAAEATATTESSKTSSSSEKENVKGK